MTRGSETTHGDSLRPAGGRAQPHERTLDDTRGASSLEEKERSAAANVRVPRSLPTCRAQGGAPRRPTILDITKARVKPVTPGQGFGPKRAPTSEELNLLESVLGGGG
jgi:hypothetical protein